MINQNNLLNILEAAIKDPKTFEQADTLYRETFRSAESFSVSDVDHDVRLEMIDWLCSDICEPYDYDAVPDWYEPAVIVEGMSRDEASKAVDGGLMFVELCNYKGEGEGIMPEPLCGNMRTFVSKWSYM